MWGDNYEQTIRPRYATYLRNCEDAQNRQSVSLRQREAKGRLLLAGAVCGLIYGTLTVAVIVRVWG